MDNINIWDIPFKGCAQEAWNKKDKEEKIRIWEMQYVINGNYYTRENTNIPVEFLKALGNSEDRELYNLIQPLIDYINYTRKRFQLFPIVFEHLNMIVTHPRFEDNLGKTLFKKLKTIIEGVLPTKPISTEQSKTKELICEKFEAMDDKGWEYAFKSEADYNTFADILTSFFEHKTHNLPNNIIQLKRNCKTKLGRTLGEIHKELSGNVLRSDTRYLKILKCLNHFHNETDLYKVLTR